MHAVHLPSIDLNLLVALDALLAERSVTGASKRLSLSQSATSHQLSRLRALLGDPLLVRTRDAMVPTARAEALAVPLRAALAQLAGALAEAPKFDPRTARRAFTIGTSDYAELVLLPPLLGHLGEHAPGIDLVVRPLEGDPDVQLASGVLDVAILPLRADERAQGCRQVPLVKERFVCVVRRGHPLTRGKLTLSRYCRHPHALIAPQGKPGSFVDDLLAARGFSRRVALTIPHFLVAPYAVAGSDLVLTLAERVARTFAKSLPLHVLRPPLDLPGFTMSMVWHERAQSDPAQQWLRATLEHAASQVT